MLSEDVLAVTIDDGLFWLMTGESGEIGEGQISVGDQDLVDDALENGSAVAQGSDEIVVVPPQQWATDRPVTVQTWAERPPSLSADWDDICEASLMVRAGGVFWGTNFNDVVKLPVRPGSYRIRIAGKGADSAEADLPADEWLLQFWPASEIVDPIRIVRPPGY